MRAFCLSQYGYKLLLLKSTIIDCVFLTNNLAILFPRIYTLLNCRFSGMAAAESVEIETKNVTSRPNLQWNKFKPVEARSRKIVTCVTFALRDDSGHVF